MSNSTKHTHENININTATAHPIEKTLIHVLQLEGGWRDEVSLTHVLQLEGGWRDEVSLIHVLQQEGGWRDGVSLIHVLQLEGGWTDEVSGGSQLTYSVDTVYSCLCTCSYSNSVCLVFDQNPSINSSSNKEQ